MDADRFEQYERWINAFETEHDNFVRGKCAEATASMVIAFPELRRACGFAHTAWGEDQHWWCVAPDGKIVDPTKGQFPYVSQYEEVDLADPHRPIPTGKCMDCGAPVFATTFCNDACSARTEDYLRRP